jgi:hypothetical protein
MPGKRAALHGLNGPFGFGPRLADGTFIRLVADGYEILKVNLRQIIFRESTLKYGLKMSFGGTETGCVISKNFQHWRIDKVLAVPRVSPPEPPGGRIFQPFTRPQP